MSPILQSYLVNKFDVYGFFDANYTVVTGSAQIVTSRLQTIVNNNQSGYVNASRFNTIPLGVATKTTRTTEIFDTTVVQGFDTTQVRIPIYNPTLGGEFTDGLGNPVYGVLSFAASVFTLTLNEQLTSLKEKE